MGDMASWYDDTWEDKEYRDTMHGTCRGYPTGVARTDATLQEAKEKLKRILDGSGTLGEKMARIQELADKTPGYLGSLYRKANKGLLTHFATGTVQL